MNDGWKNALVIAYGLKEDESDPDKDMQYAVTFKIADGEDAGETIKMDMSPAASPKAWDFTINTLHKLGGKGDDLSEIVLNTEKTHSILVETKDYKGQPRQQIAGVAGSTPKKDADKDRAKAFAAKMKAKNAGNASNGASDDDRSPF